jgi:hypothetical protein
MEVGYQPFHSPHHSPSPARGEGKVEGEGASVNNPP